MQIFNFSSCSLSNRNGTYGGNSGDKEGIIFNNDSWIVKYPKKVSRLTGVTDLLYTTTPESEYIGSHIYELLGIPVHETILGIKNDHVVVACKDFCDDNTRLVEFRQLKNTYNKTLNEKLDMSMSSTGSDHFVLLNEILIHLDYNPSISNISGIKERFWDCVIIDGFINNNDRNNGNWGILRKNDGDYLAPVYDNGSSFSPNVSEKRIISKLNNKDSLEKGIIDAVTAYSLDGKKNATFVELLKLDNKDLKKALTRVVPLIKSKMPYITKMIDEIPEFIGTYSVISKERKDLYKKEIQVRLEKVLMPEYEKIRQKKQVQKTKSDDFELEY